MTMDPNDKTGTGTEGSDKKDEEKGDPFSIAWDEATAPKIDGGAAKDKAVTTETKTDTKTGDDKSGETKTGDDKSGETKTGEGETKTGEGETKTGEKTPAEEAAAKKATDDAIAASAAEKAAADQKAAADVKAATETTAAAKVEDDKGGEAKEPEPYKPTTEEAAEIAKFDKEWPEISRATALNMRAALFNSLQYTFAEVHRYYDPTIKRFEALADALEDQLTLIQLRGAHADYDTVFPQVEAWVKTLPAAHRRGAEAIIKEGSPEDVIELIGEFKKAKVPPPAPAAPQAKELSEAAKKAAGKLTVVEGKRTATLNAPDPNDFEQGWKEATAEEERRA
jgi:hypothetical protein